MDGVSLRTDAAVEFSFRVQAVLAEAAADHDLTVTGLRLLGILRDREPAMLDLAHHMGVRKSSLSGLIDRTEARGLVERIPAGHDGRGVHVRLTARGRRLGRTLETQVEQRLDALLAELE